MRLCNRHKVGAKPIKNEKYINKTGDLKKLPVLYENKDNCCGCFSCYSACPVSAIIMLPDEEGFLYPVIDAQKCISCFLCVKSCGFKSDQGKKGLLNG